MLGTGIGTFLEFPSDFNVKAEVTVSHWDNPTHLFDSRYGYLLQKSKKWYRIILIKLYLETLINSKEKQLQLTCLKETKNKYDIGSKILNIVIWIPKITLYSYKITNFVELE